LRHTGFNVHSRVRAKTKTEAERIGKYMSRPVLSLERLSFEKEGQVSYRYGCSYASLAPLSPPAAIFLFDLTTDDTEIYHPQRWGEATSVLSTLIQHAYQKMKSLSFWYVSNLCYLSGPKPILAALSAQR